SKGLRPMKTLKMVVLISSMTTNKAARKRMRGSACWAFTQRSFASSRGPCFRAARVSASDSSTGTPSTRQRRFSPASGKRVAVPVADIVVLGDHDSARMGDPRLPQHFGRSVAAFDQGRAQLLRGRRQLLVRPSRDYDHLFAEPPQLFERAEAQPVQAAEDDVVGVPSANHHSIADCGLRIADFPSPPRARGGEGKSAIRNPQSAILKSVP